MGEARLEAISQCEGSRLQWDDYSLQDCSRELLRIERDNIYRERGTIRSENFRSLLIGFRKNDDLSFFSFNVENSA